MEVTCVWVCVLGGWEGVSYEIKNAGPYMNMVEGDREKKHRFFMFNYCLELVPALDNQISSGYLITSLCYFLQQFL